MTHPRDEHDDHDEPASAAKREFRGSFADHNAAGQEEHWTVLRTLRPAEAEHLRDKLDAAGLPCELQDQSTDAAAADDPASSPRHPVDVLVLEEDLDLARDIASRDADHADDSDDEEVDPAEHEARMLANWMCPRCGEQQLELLPRKRWWYHLFVAWLAILLIPILVELAMQVTADPPLFETYAQTTRGFLWLWLLAIIGLAWALLVPQREKRCKACGWDSRVACHAPPAT